MGRGGNQTGPVPAKSGNILEAVLYRGELPRGEAETVAGTGERQADVVSALLDKEVLASESPRAPLGLAFPAALASRWMPGLFPEKSDSRAINSIARFLHSTILGKALIIESRIKQLQ
jgi:hypothetical protein